MNPDTAGTIAAVGVLVPARDEEDLIGRCLDSVLTALAVVPTVQAGVCVVLDRCRDRTAKRAVAVLRGRGAAFGMLARHAPATVGELRNHGADWLLRRLGAHHPSAVWLLSTDADTTVGPDWVRDHLQHAAVGADAVVGLADLDDDAHLSPSARLAYTRLVGDGVKADGHSHVYAANLGVRADSFRAVGGFPAVRHGEDHGLADRLRAGGFRIVTALDARVRTSARISSRAVDGLGDLLAGL